MYRNDGRGSNLWLDMLLFHDGRVIMTANTTDLFTGLTVEPSKNDGVTGRPVLGAEKKRK